MQFIRRHLWSTLLFTALAVLGSQSIYADGDAPQASPVSAPPEQSLRFQRVFVPSGKPEEWPRDKGTRYIPMPAAEFESRLKLLNGQTPTNTDRAAWLANARYTVALEKDCLSGTLDWNFESKSSDRTVVMLNGCELSLHEPRLIDPSKNDSGKPAILGNDSFGRLAAFVDGTQTMRCRWELQGNRATNEVISFALHLPACLSSTLELNLPADVRPEIQHGIVTLADTQSEIRRWRIDLGGANQQILRIVKRSSPAAVASATRTRATFAYQISERGLELRARLRVAGIESLRTLEIFADGSLENVAARANGVNLKVAPGVDKNGLNSYIIDISNASLNPNDEVLITADAPIAFDRNWQLPLIQAAGNWEEGTAQLSFSVPLKLTNLRLDGCCQIKRDSTTKDDEKHVLLQFFEARPRIELTVSRDETRTKENGATVISLRANEGTARYTAEFVTTQGSRFSLDAEIAPNWILTSVESVPVGLVSDWTQQGRLKIQLASPNSSRTPLRLSVTARRRRAPLGDSLKAQDLEILHFNDVAVERHLTHVQAVEPFQLRVHGDEALSQATDAALTKADKSFLGDMAPGLTFLNNGLSDNLAVSILARPAQYDAEIQAQVNASEGVIVEQYRFNVLPQGREINRLSVRFSQPRSGPLTWSIDGDPSAVVVARKLVEDSAARPNTGELWEITLPAPRGTAFSLVAERRSVQRGDTPVALAALSDADSQRGTIQISAATGYLPEIRSTRRLKSIPVSSDESGESATELAAFQYNPEEDALNSAEPPLVVAAPTGNAGTAPIWIWNAKLVSRCASNEIDQRLACEVETQGGTQLTLSPPAGAVFSRAWINRRLASADEVKVTPDRWQIELPSGERFADLAIEWVESKTGSDRMFARVDEHMPRSDVPILAQSWTLELPPGLTVADSTSNRLPWTARLFGPFAAHNAVDESDKTERSILKNGWTAYGFAGLDDSSNSVWITDPIRTAAWAWAAFLTALSLSWIVGGTRPTLLLLIFIVATVVALLAPTLIVPVTSAIWLGLVAGYLAQTCQRVFRVQQTEIQPSKVAASLVAGFLIAACLPSHTIALAESSAVASVLIPVDANGKPEDENYFVPEALSEELIRRTPEFEQPPPAWLLCSARYEAGAQPLGSNALPIGDWKATLNVYTLRERCDVELKPGAHGTVLIPDSVTLDGQPASEQLQNHTGLALAVAKKGNHTIEVRFRPIVESDELRFSITRAADSELHLSNAEQLQLKLGKSGVAPMRIGDELRIGNADEVSLRKQEELLPEAIVSADEYSSDELFVIHPGVESTKLEARFRVSVLSGRVQQFRLAIDSQLKPILESASGDFANATIAEDDAGTLLLKLEHPIARQAHGELTFEFANRASTGNWFLPKLALVGAKSERKFWAVVASDSISAVPLATNGLEVAETSQLGRLWGSADPKLSNVWVQTSAPTGPFLSTRPRESHVDCRDQFRLIVGVRETSVHWNAKLSASGPIFQYRLNIPAELEIESVSLRQQGTIYPVEWARSSSDLARVFFPDTITGDHELIIAGKMKTPADGVLKPPVPSIDGVVEQECRLAIFRRHSMLVEVSIVGDWQAVPATDQTSALDAFEQDSAGMSESGKISPIAILEANGRTAQPTLRVQRNELEARAIETTTIEKRGADAWKATVDLNLTVEKGLLDNIRFNLPTNWVGPFEVTPTMATSIEGNGIDGTKQLVLHPEHPLSGEFSLRISGPVQLVSGQRPSVPDVRLADLTRVIRFVLLPRRADQQQLEWDRRSLAPRPAPVSMAANLGNSALFRSFQVTGDNFRAQLRSFDQPSRSPRIHLADIAVALQSDGVCSGVSAIDLEPGDATSFQIEVPTNLKLVQAKLDGVPAQLSPLGNNQNLTIGNSQVPRHLEIIFTGRVSIESDRALQFLLPALVGVPVERTLWTVAGPAGALLEGEGAQSITAAQLRDLRIDSMESLADSALQSLANEPTEDRERWYRPWAERYSRYRSSGSAAAVASKSTSETPKDHEKGSLAADWLQLAIPDAANAKQNCFRGDEKQSVLRLEISSPPKSDFMPRLAAALLGTLLAVGLVAGVRRELFKFHSFSAWPAVSGALLGLAWWFWLTPAWVGVLIIAGSILSTLAENWTANAPPEASTVQSAAKSPSRRFGVGRK